jgi:hypothetical protein
MPSLWSVNVQLSVHMRLLLLQVVAGALVEGDETEETDGNAGSWINVQLMLEEVSARATMTYYLPFPLAVPVLTGMCWAA